MGDHQPPGWEPNPSRMGNWRAMFDQPRGAAPTLAPALPPAEPERPVEVGGVDLTEYRPWIVQRGRARPAIMLELRRYEPRSRLWQGWIMAYPNLQAVEYLGDTMVALDFGVRQFVIKGEGLSELARQLQHGSVLAVQEYAQAVWPVRATGPVVTAIVKAGSNT